MQYIFKITLTGYHEVKRVSNLALPYNHSFCWYSKTYE